MATEAAAAAAAAAALAAEAASIDNEVQSNITKIRDIDEGTTDQYKDWKDIMTCSDKSLCLYNLMHNSRFEFGPHVEETELQSKIGVLNAMSNKYASRAARSEVVKTTIYLLVREIEELAKNENISLRWDPFKDFVTVDLNHHLPKIRGGNANRKKGFIDTNIVPELDGDISDAIVLDVISWMREYWEESGEEYTIGDNVKIVDATTLALMYEGLPHINPKCRLLITTEFECIQLCTIDGTVHITCDGTDVKKRKKSYITISEYLMPELIENGALVPTNIQIKVLRHQFAFHCTTSYLGTEEEQAAGVIPAIWKAPYEKDHADGDNTNNTGRNLRNCHRDDNNRAYNLEEGKHFRK